MTFSQLGKECFWMLTGGHPGLMQLLVHYLYETAKQEHSSGNQARAGFVIVSEVKQTVNDILSDPMSSDYIQHLRSEFHPDELRLMETLAINNYMFSGTCFFRPDRLSKPAGWVGIDSLQAQLQKDHGYQELNLSIKDLLDRLVDKEVFEVEATGIVRWRIGFFFSMILYY
ncbi:MAG: hypothetical protein H6650_17580 [Ardenticatenales bacterium]|nr:hypothetical protein [Ardenticatenales bacterium]